MIFAVAFLQEARALDMDSYISIAVLVVVSGGIWRLAVMLTEIKSQLQRLRHLPARMTHIENHLMMFEEDVNNLFGAVRAATEPEKLLDFTRRARFRPFQNPTGDDAGS